jgi:tetratricopeptide (TPR) repeat protein
MVMGTPNYMSPEQVRGESVEPWSDVFSLGAILYELLSYTKPFKGESLHDTMLKVLRGSRLPLPEVAPNVPDALVEIVDKALSISPADRYRDGLELLDSLQKFRENPSLATSTPWMAEPSDKSTEQVPSTSDKDGESGEPSQSLAGNLSSMHLADLLQWCSIKGKTGTLRVRFGPIEKKLYFRSGQLFSSSSNSPRETLGQLLVRSGFINEEQLFKALLGQEQSKLPLGRILISEGLLGEGELQHLLQLKCKESIYDCFLWTEGEFVFEEHLIAETVPVSFSLDISRVIQEGIERMDKWESIRKKFSSRLTTFTLNKQFQEALDSKELTEEEQRILELVERDKNLAEIALELHAVDFYAASRLLELCERGWIRVSDVPEELPYEEQVQELRERLGEGLRSFQKGEHAKALSAFEAALEIDPHSKANLFVDKISRIFEDAAEVRKVPREGVPVLKVGMDELAELDLEPQDGFVLSRMSGDWDVRSILKICPLSEIDVLKIIKKFMDKGIIELTTEGGTQSKAAAGTVSR